MTVQWSPAVRNSMLDAWETAVGVSAKIEIRTSAQQLIGNFGQTAEALAPASAASDSLIEDFAQTAFVSSTVSIVSTQLIGAFEQLATFKGAQAFERNNRTFDVGAQLRSIECRPQDRACRFGPQSRAYSTNAQNRTIELE